MLNGCHTMLLNVLCALALVLSALVLSAGVSWAQSNATQAKNTVGFANATNAQVHSQIRLRGEVQAAFRKFRDTGSVYGAMYVTPDGSRWSWRSGRYSVEDAKLAAKVDCEAFHKARCVLYATVVPKGPSHVRVFLPNQNKDLWRKAVRNTRPGNYMAIAGNKTGASGFAWNYGLPSQARDAALRQCEQNQAGRGANENARVVAANKAAGIYKCRLIGTFR